MATKVTRWRPDTCDCVVEYAWDDAQPEDARGHDLHAVVHRCPAHAALPDDASCWAAVSEENPRKNQALDALVGLRPELRSPDGDLMVGWHFDANRELHLTTPTLGLAGPQRAALTTALRARLGHQRVVLD